MQITSKMRLKSNHFSRNSFITYQSVKGSRLLEYISPGKEERKEAGKDVIAGLNVDFDTRAFKRHH